MALKCQKIVRKVAKNTSMAEPPSTSLECFLVNHNFLDWYEILNLQTRLVCATFPQKYLEMDIIWRRNKLPKFIVIQKCPNFEFWIAPNIQNNLDSHGNFATITRL